MSNTNVPSAAAAAAPGAAWLKGGVASPAHATSFVEALWTAADREPKGLYVAITDGAEQSRPFTYADIRVQAERIATGLHKAGCARGDRVLLFMPNHPALIPAFFGAMAASAVPVPLPFPPPTGDAPRFAASLARMAETAGARWLIATRQHAALAEVLAKEPPAPRLLPVEELLETTGPGREPDVRSDDVGLLQFTSGPFLAPHGVTLTHRHLLAQVDAVGRALELGPRDVGVSWLPMVHDMGLVGVVLTSLYWRYPVHVMPPEAFLMHPHRWIRTLGRLGATISAAPNFAYQLCVRRLRDTHLEGVDLSRWRLALNGAEQVQPATLEAFATRLAGVGFRPSAFVPLYGLAENTLAATCPPLGRPYHKRPTPAASPSSAASPTAADWAAEVVAVGRPLAGQEIAIWDDADRPCATGEVGHVVVRGNCVMQGYWNEPQKTAAAVHDGWLRSGDLGFVADGELFIVGRHKEAVIKMGRNYYPSDVEQVLRGTLGPDARAVAVADSNKASATEDLLVVVEATAPTPEAVKELEGRLNAALLGALGLRADRIHLVPPGALGGAGDLRERRRRALRLAAARELS